MPPTIVFGFVSGKRLDCGCWQQKVDGLWLLAAERWWVVVVWLMTDRGLL